MANGYYLEIQSAQLGAQTSQVIWEVDENGTANPYSFTSSLFHNVPFVELKENFSYSQFHKLKLSPGEYYPRMARPFTSVPFQLYLSTQTETPGANPDKSLELRKLRAASTGQLHALIEQFERVCRVVHPDSPNYDVFGHEIRNILILACTEVEAQWKGILDANEYKKDSEQPIRMTTADYVKLCEALKLDEYTVELTYYPWLPIISPFANWKPESPTQSLQWYHAYNSVKHDRENQFNRATLYNALCALTGCFVILCAQYGWDFARKGEAGDSIFFRLIEAPNWPPDEYYVPIDEAQKRPYFE